MKYQFIEDHRNSGMRIRTMCKVLSVSPSGYYTWSQHPKSQREASNNQLLEKIRDIHRESKSTYGSPRITLELHSRGEQYGKNRIARLMQKHRIRAKMSRKFRVITTKRNINDPVAPNLVQQHFVADCPNQLWSSDITYIWTREGWLYLAVILDVYSRAIIGYAVSHRLTTNLVLDAFTRALSRRTISPGLILHSDRGCQYTSKEFQQVLASYHIRSSMSAKGNCYDNAITETFFHTLKTEHIYFERFQSRREAELSIFEYIEIFYNRKRIHSSLGYRSPFDFEQQQIIA